MISSWWSCTSHNRQASQTSGEASYSTSSSEETANGSEHFERQSLKLPPQIPYVHSEDMTRLHGAGSVSSPIVISDDEDECLVERALENRLSDPRDLEVSVSSFEYGDDGEISGLRQQEVTPDSYMNDTSREQDSKRKRKRSEDLAEDPLLSPRHIPKVALGIPNQRKKLKSLEHRHQIKQPAHDPLESKSARKKRRKRERIDAEAAALQSDIPELALKHATPPPQLVAGSSRLKSPNLPPRHVANPPLEELRPLSPQPDPSNLPIPYSIFPQTDHGFAMSIPAPLMPLPPIRIPPLADFGPPPLVPPLPMMAPGFDLGAVYPSLFNAMHGLLPHTDFPQIPDSNPHDLQPAAACQPPGLPRNVIKKIIGMPADLDLAKGHGIYNMVKESPSDRSLVLECLPKKFRSMDFLSKWAWHFGHVANLELDAKVGKALVVFQDAKTAREAWSSPRLPTGDGKEHIRAYWYRVQGVEFEEGEIEEWELEDVEKLKQQTTQQRPVRNGSAQQYVAVKPSGLVYACNAIQSSASTSQLKFGSFPSFPATFHSSRLPLVHSLSRNPAVSPPSETVAPPPFLPQRRYSMPDDSMDVASDNERGTGLLSSAVQLEILMGLSDVPVARPELPSRPTSESSSRAGSPQKGPRSTVVSTVHSTEASSSAGSSRTSSLPALSTSRSSTPADAEATPPPVESRSVKGANFKQTLLTRQKELEERIARGRLEIAARTLGLPGSHSPSQTVQSNNTQVTTDVGTTPPVTTESSFATTSESSSDIYALRQLVQASKKSRASALATAAAAEAPPVSTDINGPPPLSSLFLKKAAPRIPPSPDLVPTIPAVFNPAIDFDELATSFINESIQSVVPARISHPLPPRPTSMTFKSSEKASLADKQAALEKHIAQSKLLMAKLSSAATKTEKDNLMAELRGSSRRAEEAMKVYSSEVNTPSEEDIRPSLLPRKTWPQTKETCILDLSDDEDES